MNYVTAAVAFALGPCPRIGCVLIGVVFGLAVGRIFGIISVYETLRKAPKGGLK